MAEWQRTTTWRQGCVLTAKSAEALGLSHPELPEATLVIVISHDCDLAQLPQIEPNCEVIIAKSVDPPANGNLAAAKNPRRLHLQFSAGNNPALIELAAGAKAFISKAVLADHEPASDICLSSEGLSTLQGWLAARYRRAAFPDAFETRLKAGKQKFIEKFSAIIKKTATDLLAVYFDLSPEGEIQDADIYDLTIDLIYSATENPEEAQKNANEAAEAIKTLFQATFCENGTWTSIELKDCSATSEAAISVMQARHLKQWHFGHLSLGEDPKGEEAKIP